MFAERSNDKTMKERVREGRYRDPRSLSVAPFPIVFSFDDFGSAFARLYSKITLLFETQTKKMPPTQAIRTLG